MFFQDPADHETWHTLRWRGLPPKGEIPAFSDKTADSLLAHVKANSIRIHTESELLEHLLGILGSVTPVDQWPSQTKKKAGKKQHVAKVSARSLAHRLRQPTAPPHLPPQARRLRPRCPWPGQSMPARSTTRSTPTAAGDARKHLPEPGPSLRRHCTRP